VDTLAEVWNGTAWSLQSSPNHANGPNVLSAVSCGTSQVCSAVGGAENANQIGITLAELGD
jgi:hypothetical protein